MEEFRSLALLLLLLAAAQAGTLAIYAWHRKPAPWALAYAAMLAVAALWAITYALELFSPGLRAKIFWQDVLLIGASSSGYVYLVFALLYTHRDRWVTRRNVLLLFAVPACLTVASWCYPSLFRATATLAPAGPFTVLSTTPGPLWMAHVILSCLAAIVGIALIAQACVRWEQPFRAQAAVLVVAGSIPLAASILFQCNVLPAFQLNFTPVAFNVSELLMGWGLFRFGMLNLVPVAREAIVNSLRDGIMVLDNEGRVVVVNRAMEELVGLPRKGLIGQLSASLPPPWRDLEDAAGSQKELVGGQGPVVRSLYPQVVALADGHGRPQGRLLILHDLTALKLTETLEARVAARTRDLSTLYDVACLIGQPLDLPTVLGGCLAPLQRATGAAAGAIFLADRAGHGGFRTPIPMPAVGGLPGRPPEAPPPLPSVPSLLRLAAQQGLPASGIEAVANSPLWTHLAASNEPWLVQNLADDDRLAALLRGSGDPPAVYLPFQALIAAPLRGPRGADGVIALLGHAARQFNVEHLGLLVTVAEQMSVAVANADLRRQAEVAAVAEERERLARDLHDSVTQMLYSQILFADAARKHLLAGDGQRAADYLGRLTAASQQALRDMRLLIYQLRPDDPHSAGLGEALRRRLETVEERAGLAVQMAGDWDRPLPAVLQEELYWMATEALNNSLKHAAATAVTITLQATAGSIDMEISDNGRGFDPAVMRAGVGLHSLAERADGLGGTLRADRGPRLRRAGARPCAHRAISYERCDRDPHRQRSPAGARRAACRHRAGTRSADRGGGYRRDRGRRDGAPPQAVCDPDGRADAEEGRRRGHGRDPGRGLRRARVGVDQRHRHRAHPPHHRCGSPGLCHEKCPACRAAAGHPHDPPGRGPSARQHGPPADRGCRRSAVPPAGLRLSHRTRAGDPQAGRQRPGQRPDRAPAAHLAADGRRPRQPHPRQIGIGKPHPGSFVCRAQRPGRPKLTWRLNNLPIANDAIWWHTEVVAREAPP